MPDLRESLAQTLGPALASQYAQRNGGGLGIQNVRRGLLWATLSDAANMTIPFADGFSPLPVPLAGQITLSGRPLLIYVSANMAAGATGDVKVSATLRGVEVTGKLAGLLYSASTALVSLSGLWVVSAPAPGEATVEVVAAAAIADGTLYVAPPENNSLTLLAVEL